MRACAAHSAASCSTPCPSASQSSALSAAMARALSVQTSNTSPAVVARASAAVDSASSSARAAVSRISEYSRQRSSACAHWRAITWRKPRSSSSSRRSSGNTTVMAPTTRSSMASGRQARFRLRGSGIWRARSACTGKRRSMSAKLSTNTGRPLRIASGIGLSSSSATRSSMRRTPSEKPIEPSRRATLPSTIQNPPRSPPSAATLSRVASAASSSGGSVRDSRSLMSCTRSAWAMSRSSRCRAARSAS